MKKKLLSLLLTAVVLAASIVTPAYGKPVADLSSQQTIIIYDAFGNPTISPRFKYLSDFFTDCQVSSSGNSLDLQTNCTMFTSGYTVKLKLTLQKYGSSWSDVTSWSKSGKTGATVLTSEYKNPDSAKYRAKAYVGIYNTSGTLVEDVTLYSDPIFY